MTDTQQQLHEALKALKEAEQILETLLKALNEFRLPRMLNSDAKRQVS